ncbi:MAG: HAMP domain-containing histidine kinase [Oscillospiraceae bacterium]|jgi:signal transduction histidine kinase|nr:HAMP domain-containing histidine kinase [Oscillospiraceae bacterium]
MIKKLRRKFIIINMSLVSAVLIFFFIALCLSTHTRLRLDTENAALAALQFGGIPGGFRPEIGLPGAKPGGDMARNIPTFYVRVSDSGEILFADFERVSITNETAAEAVKQALESNQRRGAIRDLGLRFVREALPNGESSIAFADMSAEQSGMRRLVVTSLVIGALSLVALFFVSLFLARMAVKPVERAWRAQQQFIADASHELKTPLTVIMANTGVLSAHQNSLLSEHMQWIDSTASEAVRMKGLVENMLELAKGEGAREAVILGAVNLSDILTNSLLSFEPVAFEENVSLTGDVQPDMEIQGNGERLSRLFAILLDNAIKYAGNGGSASVTLRQSGSHILLSVSNTGAVIPAEHLPRIFDRFYRVDESRSSVPGGSFGLGLAIARQIAEEHGAKLWAESSAEAGTVFTVQFRK